MAMMQRPRYAPSARTPLITNPAPVIHSAPPVAAPTAPPVEEVPAPIVVEPAPEEAVVQESEKESIRQAVVKKTLAPLNISTVRHVEEPSGNVYQAFLGLQTADAQSGIGILAGSSTTQRLQAEVASLTKNLERMKDANPFEAAREARAQQEAWVSEAQKVQEEREERKASLTTSVENAQALKGLHSQRSSVREDAVQKLQNLEVDVPNDLIVSLVQDTSWFVRSWAAEKLKEKKEDSLLYVTKVVPLLGHSDEAVRETAIEILLEAPPQVHAHISGELLGQLLQESSYSIRTPASNLLKALVVQNPDLHMKEMVVLLQHKNSNVRESAVEVVQGLPEYDHLIPVGIVAELLKDTNSTISYWAAAWFKGQGAKAFQHIGDLLRMLQDSNSQTRETTVGVLQAMGDEVGEFIPADILAMCLQDSSWTVRSWAVDVFRAKKATVEENAKHVLPLLRRCDTMGRESAVEALQAMDFAAADASSIDAEVLTQLLTDSSLWVRTFAVEAFKGMGAFAAVHYERVLPLLTHELSSTRESAAEVVINMGEVIWQKIPGDVLVELTSDISGVVQELAQKAFAAR